jgi:carotenoid cleavage dioxygenase
VSVLFPDNTGFRGAVRPARLECDIFELEYRGELPSALQGRFYRCGPDPQFPPRSADDFFINGDGVVSMFRFADGHVDFKSRYVRTDKFKAERAARRALFGGYRNPFTDDPSVRGIDRSTANTSVLFHAGRLFALKEDGLPYELDPDTLETRGKFSFDGALRMPAVTAHPKVDPQSGELVFYGYEAAGEASCEVAYAVADERLMLREEQRFVPPYASMIHDFAVTEHYLVFPIMPTTSDLERMKAGGSHWAWDDAKPSYVGILPRNGSPRDIRYFRGPPRWSFHTMNAFEQDSRIHIDLTVSEINGFPYFPNVQGKPWDPMRARSYLTRWTCDLASNDESFHETRLWDMPADFLTTHPRVQMRPYRHGYMAAKDASKPPCTKAGVPGPIFNTLAHIDHRDARVDSYYVGDEAAVQEPVFVPRTSDSVEGDGFLLAVVNRYDEARADLIVCDASNVARGPIATVHLPIPLRMTFHGDWVPERSVGAH